jgi:hypothetical protein
MSVLVTAAATGRPHADIADEAGVSLRTVARRLSDPAIAAQVDEARQRMLDAGLGAMLAVRTRAWQKLAIDIEDQDPSVRLRAMSIALTAYARHEATIATQQRHASSGNTLTLKDRQPSGMPDGTTPAPLTPAATPVSPHPDATETVAHPSTAELSSPGHQPGRLDLDAATTTLSQSRGQAAIDQKEPETAALSSASATGFVLAPGQQVITFPGGRQMITGALPSRYRRPRRSASSSPPRRPERHHATEHRDTLEQASSGQRD